MGESVRDLRTWETQAEYTCARPNMIGGEPLSDPLIKYSKLPHLQMGLGESIRVQLSP